MGVETGGVVGMGLKNGVVRPPVGLAVDRWYGLWTAVTACTFRSHGLHTSSEDVTALPG